MSGWIDETCFSEVKEQRLSDQSDIRSFTGDDTTYIAVVSLPRHNIEEYVDEVCTDLGMPENRLKEFLSLRAGYRTNSAVDSPHEKAYADLGLRSIYQSLIEQNISVDRKITQLANRVAAGENITLVCFEEDGKSCHRHLLVDEIRSRVEERDQSKFTFTVQSSKLS